MSENTKIEWCDHTFNPWEGCQKVGPGCDHCYAETRNARFAGGTAINWGPGAPRRRTSASNWELPKRWNAQADAFMAQHGRRQRVFCASLADVFDNAVDPQWRADLFALIRECENLDWLLLTKRIANTTRMLPWVGEAEQWPHVWIGATIVNQAEADRDIRKLLDVPARVRFLSMEPLLEPVDLTRIPVSGSGHHEFDPIITANVLKRAESYPALPQVDWVIVGGESGPGARPMHPDWARSLRDQCEAAGVPFLFKQWGEWASVGTSPVHPESTRIPGNLCRVTLDGVTADHYVAISTDGGRKRYEIRRVGKKAAGRLLDGRTWDGFPA
jgi:protein gp37